jgi:hypothetical protein
MLPYEYSFVIWFPVNPVLEKILFGPVLGKVGNMAHFFPDYNGYGIPHGTLGNYFSEAGVKNYRFFFQANGNADNFVQRFPAGQERHRVSVDFEYGPVGQHPGIGRRLSEGIQQGGVNGRGSQIPVQAGKNRAMPFLHQGQVHQEFIRARVEFGRPPVKPGPVPFDLFRDGKYFTGVHGTANHGNSPWLQPILERNDMP